jgi:sulfite reductase alpha subunit-like flavoprotein
MTLFPDPRVDNTLYFGCRSATKDQHYVSEWTNYVADGTMIYRVACSRDGPEGSKRTYVQDLMQDDSEKLWDLIGNRGACVFISG